MRASGRRRACAAGSTSPTRRLHRPSCYEQARVRLRTVAFGKGAALATRGSSRRGDGLEKALKINLVENAEVPGRHQDETSRGAEGTPVHRIWCRQTSSTAAAGRGGSGAPINPTHPDQRRAVSPPVSTKPPFSGSLAAVEEKKRKKRRRSKSKSKRRKRKTLKKRSSSSSGSDSD